MQNEDNLIEYIQQYYRLSLEVVKEFGGPSVYFHVQAILEQQEHFLSDRHLEMIYATLSSWGMHRMGNQKNKTKMVEFSDFKESIISQQEIFTQLVSLRMETCTAEEYQSYLGFLENTYQSLKVSISEATIVAHSKTIAHILPNLIPPIDRQYTIRFFTQDNKSFFTPSGKYKNVKLPRSEEHFSTFKDYCIRIKKLFDRCNHQIFTINNDDFNTSYPKIMDNLIMAFVKSVPKPT